MPRRRLRTTRRRPLRVRLLPGPGGKPPWQRPLSLRPPLMMRMTWMKLSGHNLPWKSLFRQRRLGRGKLLLEKPWRGRKRPLRRVRRPPRCPGQRWLLWKSRSPPLRLQRRKRLPAPGKRVQAPRLPPEAAPKAGRLPERRSWLRSRTAPEAERPPERSS